MARKVPLDLEGQVKVVDLGKLHLDKENPRLPKTIQKTDKAIFEFIAETTAIEDLVNAIAMNDYFPGEPLVVIPHGQAGHYTVVEGNRRLTALNLLHNPKILSKPSQRLQTIVKEARFLPDRIPVVERETRAEVLPYLGFRHITGVKQWEPLSKARYMYQLFDALKKPRENPESRYQAVAKAIGSRSNHIKRNLDALAVYQHIEKKSFYKIDGLNEATLQFGTLYTALSEQAISAFVGTSEIKISKAGVASYADTHAIINPQSINAKHAKELCSWMFEENGDGETILGESRNIRRLARIIAEPQALAALRKGATLQFADRLTTGTSEDFMQSLYAAEAHITEALSLSGTASAQPKARELVNGLIENLEVIMLALDRKRSATRAKN